MSIEIRCIRNNCNQLLMKYNLDDSVTDTSIGQIEIKCPKCKRICVPKKISKADILNAVDNNILKV